MTAEVIEETDQHETHHLISLKEFLRLKKCKGKEKERIKARVKKAAKQDPRITIKEGKPYLDPSRFDYADLLSE